MTRAAELKSSLYALRRLYGRTSGELMDELSAAKPQMQEPPRKVERNGTVRVIRDDISLRDSRSETAQKTYTTKHGTVEMLLEDEEWSQWSDREIARRCSVSHQTVANIRASICQKLTDSEAPPRKVERNGTVYTQNTANIMRELRIQGGLADAS